MQRNNIKISDRAFSINGPKFRNQLPTALKSEFNFVRFEGDLKTCLFRGAFNQSIFNLAKHSICYFSIYVLLFPFSVITD